MGQIIAYSGYADNFTRMEQACNIPWILAHGLQIYTGMFYPLFIPLPGWVGTFLTGYGVVSIMLFGKLQMQATALLGVSATWLAAGFGSRRIHRVNLIAVQDCYCHAHVRRSRPGRGNTALDHSHRDCRINVNRSDTLGRIVEQEQ